MKPAVVPHALRNGCYAAVLLFALTATPAGAVEPDGERKGELIHMLKHDCGSCHGMTLKGGLGPALRPDILEDKPEVMLRATILVGRPGTPMPPWQGILTEQEVDWLVGTLKKGIPDAH